MEEGPPQAETKGQSVNFQVTFLCLCQGEGTAPFHPMP